MLLDRQTPFGKDASELVYIDIVETHFDLWEKSWYLERGSLR